MNKKKIIYNYNIEQSNQLIKKGMFPIGCGINPKTGGFFLVFCGTQGYFNTLDLIALENKQREQMQEWFLCNECHWNICGSFIVVSNTAFWSCFYSILVWVEQHETSVLDTVNIYDESYYIRLINTYSITAVIKYSLNILMIILLFWFLKGIRILWKNCFWIMQL